MIRKSVSLFCIAGISLAATLAASAATVEAARTLHRGTIINSSDVVITPNSPRRGQIETLHDVVGKEVRSTLREGRPIRYADLRAPILVERNQLVDIFYRAGSLIIRGEGRALRQGGSGERIRVMNLDSRIVVSGRVTESGQIEVNR